MRVNAQPKILVFSKYFGYNLGGAERSMFELLRGKEREGYVIHAVVAEDVQTYDAQKHRMRLPSTWVIMPFKWQWDAVRFRYWAYAANRTRIKEWFSRLEPGYELFAYGHYAPAAILGYRGSSVYLVRDEYGLGWDENYEVGWKRQLRSVYQAVEIPFRRRWRRDLHAAMQKSRLVANSQFIGGELRKIMPGADVEIVVPEIDSERLKVEYASALKNGRWSKGVVMVGHSRLKGTDVFLGLAAQVPDETFYVFDRAFDKPTRRNNVMFMPWQANAGHMYAYAKVVMVPSRWAEAFPRVIVEAQSLGLPVVASDRGGIPEALDDHRCLVADVENLDEWKVKVSPFLSLPSAK